VRGRERIGGKGRGRGEKGRVEEGGAPPNKIYHHTTTSAITFVWYQTFTRT